MKKRMNAKVFCRNNEYGKMDFYLEMDREVLYNGRRLEEMYSKTSMIRHQKLKERILRMSKYIAQEHSVDIFEKSSKPTYERRKNDDFDYEAA